MSHMQNNTEFKQLNDWAWQSALKDGKDQFGNLEVNLRFLEQVECLKSENRILELGCGVGTIVNWLQNRGFNAFGSDISEVAIEYGRQKYPKVCLSVESADALRWKDNEFDAVISFDVLEHIPDTDRHLHEVWRILKTGGYYLFQTPNKYASASFDTIRTRSLRWKTHHPSLHSPRQLKKRLQKNNFSVRFIKMNPVTPFFIKKLKNAPFLAWLAKYIPFQRLPLCLQTNLYVIAQKVTSSTTGSSR